MNLFKFSNLQTRRSLWTKELSHVNLFGIKKYSICLIATLIFDSIYYRIRIMLNTLSILVHTELAAELRLYRIGGRIMIIPNGPLSYDFTELAAELRLYRIGR